MDTLDRFIRAQDGHYEQALAELRAGRKSSHWIWFVLPQLRGLGRSPMALAYGITGRVEAQAYLDHPVLGERLRTCVQALLAHTGRSAVDVLGDIDAMKCRSCLTLFDAMSPSADNVFNEALHAFYGGEPDAATLALL